MVGVGGGYGGVSPLKLLELNSEFKLFWVNKCFGKIIFLLETDTKCLKGRKEKKQLVKNKENMNQINLILAEIILFCNSSASAVLNYILKLVLFSVIRNRIGF